MSERRLIAERKRPDTRFNIWVGTESTFVIFGIILLRIAPAVYCTVLT
jgi:hypothetical protein